ncbi:MAG: hypothetical protein JJE40_15990 [Vicinamibacteria bacterium]|nr:hypothetical protein [Vicinamibacteria bacterium]
MAFSSGPLAAPRNAPALTPAWNPDLDGGIYSRDVLAKIRKGGGLLGRDDLMEEMKKGNV